MFLWVNGMGAIGSLVTSLFFFWLTAQSLRVIQLDRVLNFAHPRLNFGIGGLALVFCIFCAFRTASIFGAFYIPIDFPLWLTAGLVTSGMLSVFLIASTIGFSHKKIWELTLASSVLWTGFCVFWYL